MAVYAVLGGGNGGQCLAAFLKAKGAEVRLWARSAALVQQLAQMGNKISLSGTQNITSKIDLVTTDLGPATLDADIVFVVLPANAHQDLARKLSQFIKPEHLLVLCPGRTAGALEFFSTFHHQGITRDLMPLIVEMQTLFCACRAVEPGFVKVISMKKKNTFATLPNNRKEEAVAALSGVFENITASDSTLNTSLDNMGAILHPAPVLLNAGCIETRQFFFAHYYQAISPTVACFLEKMDAERISVASAYGIQAISVKKWHEENYGLIGSNLFETLQMNSAYAALDAPHSLNHRYIHEDVPTGLVPISELGKAAGIETPFIDTVIDLSEMLLGKEYRKEGRNLQNLGLNKKKPSDIASIFNKGI